MNHFKILKNFLFLTIISYSFGLKIDDFSDGLLDKDKMPLNSNTTDLGTLNPPISATRSYTMGIEFNQSNQNLKYNYGGSANLTYELTPSINMKDIPIINLNFVPSPVITYGNFLNKVILTDSKGKNISTDHLRPRATPQIFDFTSQFASVEENTNQFDYQNINKIDVILNSLGGAGVYYNGVTFELMNIEAVPEPFSMVTVGFGVTNLIRRKKFNRPNV